MCRLKEYIDQLLFRNPFKLQEVEPLTPRSQTAGKHHSLGKVYIYIYIYDTFSDAGTDLGDPSENHLLDRSKQSLPSHWTKTSSSRLPNSSCAQSSRAGGDVWAGQYRQTINERYRESLIFSPTDSAPIFALFSRSCRASKSFIARLAQKARPRRSSRCRDNRFLPSSRSR